MTSMLAIALELTARSVALILVCVGVGVSIVAGLIIWWKRRR